MISHGKDIKIFTGNANPKLAADICKIIGTKLGESEVKSFADGEASVSLYETVRGSDVFLVQSTCKPVNDSLMELLIMVDACRRASAGRITAVMPYFGYARQDRKAKSRDPISAKLVANMLVAAGVDRVLTMDLHANQIQGFFDIPVDNLFGNPIFVDYYAKKFGSVCEDMVVVSPDVGSVARARTFAQKLHMNLAIVDKRRQSSATLRARSASSSTTWSTPPVPSATRPRPSLRSAARRRSTPARLTAFSPAPRSSAWPRAASKSSPCSTPSPPLPAKRSSPSPASST